MRCVSQGLVVKEERDQTFKEDLGGWQCSAGGVHAGPPRSHFEISLRSHSSRKDISVASVVMVIECCLFCLLHFKDQMLMIKST